MAILWERMDSRKRRSTKPPAPLPARPARKSKRAKFSKPPPPRTEQTVDRVVDGQTFLTRGGEYIRLARIQAPPPETAAGMAAKCWLAAYCSPGVTISFERKRCDEDGRTIAEVFVLDKNISDLMLKQSAVSRIKKAAPTSS